MIHEKKVPVKANMTDKNSRRNQLRIARKALHDNADVMLPNETVVEPSMILKYDLNQRFGLDGKKGAIQPSRVIAKSTTNDMKIGNLTFRLYLPMKTSDMAAYYANLGKASTEAGSITIHFTIKKALSPAKAKSLGRGVDTWVGLKGKYIAITTKPVNPKFIKEQLQTLSTLAAQLRKKYKNSTITVIPSVKAIPESDWNKHKEEEKK